MDLVVRAEWYNTSVIVTRVLRNFPSKQVLSLALVNKEWNFVAKSLLKTRRNIVAKIGAYNYRLRPSSPPVMFQATNLPQDPVGDPSLSNLPAPRSNRNACEDLVKFAAAFRGPSTVPIFGLDITVIINHDELCERPDKAAIDAIRNSVVLQELKISICKLKDGDRNYCCKVFQHVQSVFKATPEALAVMPATGLELNFGSAISSNGLAALQTLEFGFSHGRYLFPQLDQLLLRQIVANAPNLKQLHFHVCLSMPDHVEWLETEMDDLLDGSRAVIVSRYSYIEDEDKGFSPSELLTPSQFNRLALRELADDDVREVSNDFLKIVLSNSQAILEKAEIHVLWLAKIFQHGLCFHNLLDLTLSINLAYFRSKFPSFLNQVLQGSLWKRCFPSLRNLKVREYTKDWEDDGYVGQGGHEAAIIETIDGFPSGCMDQDEDAYLDVRKLKLMQEEDTSEHAMFLTVRELEFLCKLCPYVTDLKVWGLYSTFPYLWSHLSGIESFHIVIAEITNLDSLFCGIHPEEVEELKGRDVEYLKTVHIVPHQSPISHLSRLKYLQFQVQPRDDDHLVFSKVTAGICLSRIPGLVIQLDAYAKKPQEPTGMQLEFVALMKDFPRLTFKTETFERISFWYFWGQE